VLAALSCLAAACLSSSFPGDDAARPATDLPQRFMVVEEGVHRPTRPDEGCRSPLADPRDGRQLRLARSLAGRGDYEVPPSAYGLGPDELLRVDCASGEPVGAVPR